MSIGERQAADVLEIALSTDIATDKSLYGGLRLVEWIRGYAVLCHIAEDAARSKGGDDRLLVVVETDINGLCAPMSHTRKNQERVAVQVVLPLQLLKAARVQCLKRS